MKSFFILAFLLALASAKLGVDFYSYQTPTRNFFNCAANQNVSRTILQIWDADGTTNQNFLASFIYSKDAQISDVDAVATVNDSFEPEAICNGVAKALPPSFNGTVWLDIQNKQSFWSRNISDRIPYLENITQSCKSHGLKTGFYSSAQAWASVFGSQIAGSDILKASPLWYLNDNNCANFIDFEYAGFGTWDTPKMKNYGGNPLLCNNVLRSINYFEV